MQKEYYCRLCHECMMDCKETYDKNKCENFKQGYNRFEYKQMIKEQAIDLKRFCNDNKIKLNYLYKMLNGEMEFKYKYRFLLNQRIFERDEYLPYLEMEGMD